MNAQSSSTSKTTLSEDDLAQQIETLRADFMKLAKTLSADVSDEVERAGQQVRKTGRDAQATATNAVIDHPLTAVGLAAFLGFLFGMILRKS
jgi:ElaB/YqjD/DUF883 family membrane-anchored ribosome-binding protein